MAALPYMQLYVADYLADTAHLTTEEHGAYLLLLFSYWQTGKPLREDRLSSVSRLSNERWASVEQSLKEFFHAQNGTWTHFRVEADLAKVGSKSKNNSEAGKASARARALAKQELENSKLTNVTTNAEQTYQRNVNHARSGDTDTDTDTDQDQKHLSLDATLPLEGELLPDQRAKKRPKKAPVELVTLGQLMAEGCDEQHAKDWLVVRKQKKAPLTVTAWNGVKAQASKAAITPAQAVQIAAENGWSGFNSTWARGESGNGQRAEASRKLSAVELVAARGAERERARQGSVPEYFGQGEFLDAEYSRTE